ncbi:hypothetical protein Emin_0937 [Elusimicrobium minutum Pei191]|uniref:Uncharacterized protein n=1 Tax=Elusimicrobium minutum (strain Pei191) TaxID=445932 RepID=B2KD94_ELUMP|nr:hypothetical protein [Elusimicrobium minutum]ACC98490.1 hypothetical protein Emin_0937 [Elusimicrobium minutum Pei191]
MENLAKDVLLTNGIFALISCAIGWAYWKHVQNERKETVEREKLDRETALQREKEYLQIIKSNQDVIAKLVEEVKAYGMKQNEIGGLQRKEHERMINEHTLILQAIDRTNGAISNTNGAIDKILDKMRIDNTGK